MTLKYQHFERFRPGCPTCRETGSALEVLIASEGDSAHLRNGILVCPRLHCRREYPVIDGIPILIANIREYLEQQLPSILRRRDLPHVIESLLSDASVGSTDEAHRQVLSSYAYDHYGDLAPELAESDPSPAAILRVLLSNLSLGAPPRGLVLDLGCGPGRSSFALAEAGADLVLGVDLSFSLASLGASLLLRNALRFDLRRSGLSYDRVEIQAALPGAEKVDFWIANALALPFMSQQLDGLCAMNLLDCLPAPHDFLALSAELLRDEASLWLSTPFDWSPQVTPPEHWIGGHSQRGQGDNGAALLQHYFSRAPWQNLVTSHCPWTVRLHDRSAMSYDCFTLYANRLPRS